MHFDGDGTQRARFWSDIAVHFSIVHYFSGFLSTKKLQFEWRLRYFELTCFYIISMKSVNNTCIRLFNFLKPKRESKIRIMLGDNSVHQTDVDSHFYHLQ
jgi:hypothetical protein